jgi:hypothetical protein
LNVAPQSVLVRAARHGRQVVKTAVDERARRLLQREAKWLRELESVSELDGQVPRVLDEGTDPDGRAYLVVTALPGTQSQVFTGNHARFLANLGKARFRATDFEVSGCCQSLQRGLRALEGRIAPDRQAMLEQAFHDCETALLYWTGPYVLSQGDFAPRNVRELGSQLFVSEWGEARIEASPLDDVLHYLMSGGRTAGGLKAAMKRAGDFAVETWPEWSWRPQVIGALTLAYLLGAVVRLAPGPRTYWKLIEKRSAWMPA